MEVTFLGSSNAFAAEGRSWSSFLVDGKYQFDAPPTLLPQLKKLRIDPGDIDVVFITHFHGDHFVGLPFLFLEYKYMTKRTRPLHIVCPPGGGEFLEDFANRVYPNILQGAGYERIYVEAEPSRDQEVAGVTFRAVPMNHVKQDNMLAFGYRVTIGDKKIAYTGDTMFCDEVAQLAEGSDVFVVDCTYPEDGGPEHMGLHDVMLVRERISPQTTMVLTHLSARPAVNGLANTLIAEDLKTFRF